MSYRVLALKWRPRRFDQLVGQPHVVQALVNSLKEQRLHHAYLFTGTRGVGKTTIARLLAKALNCETGIVAGAVRRLLDVRRDRRGPVRRPDRGRRGVAHESRRHARAARQRPVRADSRPVQGVPHRRGAHAVDALVQRAPEDARGAAAAREVPVRDHGSAEVAGHRAVALPAVQPQAPHVGRRSSRGSTQICEAEGIPADADGLKALARAADGSMRDALSLLDQGVAFGGGKVEAAAIRSMLGSIDREHVLRLLEALARSGRQRAARGSRPARRALRPTTARCSTSLLAALQHIAVLQLVKGRLDDDRGGGSRAARRRVLRPRTCSSTTRSRSPAGATSRYCRDPRMGFEMTLLRMLAFRPVDADAPRAADGQCAALPARRTARRTGSAPRPSGAASPRRRRRPRRDVTPQPASRTRRFRASRTRATPRRNVPCERRGRLAGTAAFARPARSGSSARRPLRPAVELGRRMAARAARGQATLEHAAVARPDRDGAARAFRPGIAS